MLQAYWRTDLPYLVSRRVLSVFAVVAMGLLGGCASMGSGCDEKSIAYVGTDGSQLRALRFDSCAGRLSMIGPVADVAKPRWTLSHPKLPIVYAGIDGSGKDGSVIAYSVDRESGALTKINEVSTGGPGVTHLSLDIASNTLLASNFGGGSASSIALNDDGSLGARVSTLKATGSGPHRRQASPHAHGSSVDPSGKYALVADMGADRVFVYGFDRGTKTLSGDNAGDPRSFTSPAGSGPRRAMFGPSGRFVYVLNELTAEIVTLRWDAQRARLSQVQSLQTSSPEFKGAKSVSEIALSRDGRFIYVGNRGESTLVVYRINAETGELTLVQRTRSGGEAPWHFEIHPSGKWLLVANYRSNSVDLFSIDTVSGMLTDTSESIATPAPVSVGFVN
jgi:6-phosphogluconolactonase